MELGFLGYPIYNLSNRFSPPYFSCHYASDFTTLQIKYEKDRLTLNSNVFFLDRVSIEGASGAGLYHSILKPLTFGSIGR